MRDCPWLAFVLHLSSARMAIIFSAAATMHMILSVNSCADMSMLFSTFIIERCLRLYEQDCVRSKTVRPSCSIYCWSGSSKQGHAQLLQDFLKYCSLMVNQVVRLSVVPTPTNEQGEAPAAA